MPETLLFYPVYLAQKTAYLFLSAVLCCVCLIHNTHANNREAYVIELQHQLPQTMIPTLKPLLRKGDGITGFQNEIIVTTDPATYKQVHTLATQLDRPLRNLLINVKNNSSGDSNDAEAGFSGGIKTGQVIIHTGEPIERKDGLTIRHEDLAFQANSTTRTTTSQSTQQIRAVEGLPAFIYTGQSRSVKNYDQWGNPTSEFIDANRGFYVTARITGERVLLEISIENDQFDDNAFDSELANLRNPVINTERLSTTVSGRIGEWISLGGISVETDENGRTYVKKSTASGGNLGDYAIKITALY